MGKITVVETTSAATKGLFKAAQAVEEKLYQIQRFLSPPVKRDQTARAVPPSTEDGNWIDGRFVMTMHQL